MDHNRHWVGTWATSPAPSETGVGFNNHTLRMPPAPSAAVLHAVTGGRSRQLPEGAPARGAASACAAMPRARGGWLPPRL